MDPAKSLYEHLKAWPAHKVRVVLEFFDSELLRQQYPGLIEVLRRAVTREPAAHRDPVKLISEIHEAMLRSGLPDFFVIGLLTTIAANLAVQQHMPLQALILHAKNSYDLSVSHPHIRMGDRLRRKGSDMATLCVTPEHAKQLDGTCEVCDADLPCAFCNQPRKLHFAERPAEPLDPKDPLVLVCNAFKVIKDVEP